MIRVGNISGFYGDRLSAMREMLDGGEIDVLTGDYLAELTMLILGRQKLKDPSGGYARTFLKQAQECLGTALERGVKIVVNAGGLNPAGLAEAVRALGGRVAHVEGDDLLPRAGELGLTGALTANAYLGAWGIAACLRGGADVVVTGRVTDASLVVGAAAAHYGWTPSDYDALAGATVAGHVIECGTQATGGNYSFFTEIPDLAHAGFPIAEIAADGSSVITKHAGTGGAVTVETVTAQLLYEIQGTHYLGPDVTTRFDTITLTPDGPDRVRISDVRGTPPPPTVKVCVNTLDGFRNSATFVLTGLDIEPKAALLQSQLGDDVTWTLARTDHENADTEETASAFLHAVVRTPDPARAKAFSRAAVELALASYPGFTLTAPPADGTPVGVYRPEYVDRAEVPHTAVHHDGTREDIPWPAETTAASHPPPGFHPAPATPSTGPHRTVHLGRIVGARSGDKGGDANLGVWVREQRAYPWLSDFLTVERLKELLPETRPLTVHRHEFPHLNALNFVIEGILGQGVAASTRFDPQAKGLGEWLRSRHVHVPEALL
ncbi:acyclic terpene utilization AtuA family protein [Actinokineospora guangxiensis]|uniref:Acyclic terpene utilization AtuA family protein n=1 Tax=Actinokineospora guangxiensis TaxID=1490288 RepID=A0ABW0EMY3_9PSEU